jgi:thioredoxin reductase
VVGAGPVGLAAAAHLARYGVPFVVLEAGSGPGAAIRQWGHVRMFSPWRYNIDRAARELLEGNGWRSPDPDTLPTGNDLVDDFVGPLASHPTIAPHLHFDARVVAIGRKDFDKVRTNGRDEQPFEIRLASGRSIDARAVIDASGTWDRPNPAASGGVAVPGERECADRIAYGIPDVLGGDRTKYAGARVLVVGSGHSAFNVILDLLALAGDGAGTEIVWAMRRDNLATVWGGGSADALAARGELGQRAKQAVDSGALRVLSPYRIRSFAKGAQGIAVSGVLRDDGLDVHVDHVIVCTGFRPDVDMLREVRLAIDPWLECSSALGPLIDPNVHSCGTVRPHGARELAHPEKNFFVVGMKSYGRAPTFLLATGYEQVRSVVALLAGDIAASERVELELPETGVCSSDLLGSDAAVGTSCCSTEPAAVIQEAATSACCSGPAPRGVDACCVDDATAKAEGGEGCGCGASEPELVQIGRASKA